MKKIVLLGIMLLVVLSLAACGQQAGTSNASKESGAVDESLKQMAAEANKTLPAMVDKETRLDSLEALPGNTLQYDYTAVNYAKADVNVDEMKKAVEAGLMTSVKANADLKELRDKKTTFNYKYSDKNKVDLFTVSITPDKYAEK